MALDGGINTVIYNLYLIRLGFGPELIGVINSIGMAVFALSCVPIGRIGEQYGLLRVMRVGVWMIFVGALLVPVVGWLPSNLFVPVLIVGTVITNIGLSAYFVSGAPYMGALSTPQQRTSIFSTQSALSAIFGFGGSLIGGNAPSLFVQMGLGTIEQPLPFQVTLWIVPFTFIVPLLLVARMREVNMRELDQNTTPAERTSHKTNAPVTPIKSLVLLLAFFGLIRFLQVGGIATLQTFFNVYMDRGLHVAPATIGAIQAIAKLVGVPSALAIPWLTRKFGNAGTVILALSAAALSMLPMAFVPAWGVAAFGYIMLWVTMPARYSAYMVFIMARTPARLHGTLNGTQEALAGLSFTVIAFFGGYIIEWLGYPPLFILGASFMIFGVVLMALYAWRERTLTLASSEQK